jgi:hypothetical protein
MRLRPMRLVLAGLLLAVSPSDELHAQTTTSGGLTGVVTDPSGASWNLFTMTVAHELWSRIRSHTSDAKTGLGKSISMLMTGREAVQADRE